MRACLHLFTKNSENSVFYQILNEDVELQQNDIFEYSDYYYFKLDEEARKIFDKSGLEKGQYYVHSTRSEPNEYWGEIRYLFLKPKE